MLRSNDLLTPSSLSQSHATDERRLKHTTEQKIVSSLLEYLDLLLRYPTSRAYVATINDVPISLAWLLIVWLSPYTTENFEATLKIYRFLYFMNTSFVHTLLRVIINAADEIQHQQTKSQRLHRLDPSTETYQSWMQICCHPAIVDCLSTAGIKTEEVLRNYTNDATLLEVMKTFLNYFTLRHSTKSTLIKTNESAIGARVVDILMSEDLQWPPLNENWIKAIKYRSFG